MASALSHRFVPFSRVPTWQACVLVVVVVSGSSALAQSPPLNGVVTLKGSELAPATLPGLSAGAGAPDFRFLRGAEQTAYSFPSPTEARPLAARIPTKISESKPQALPVLIPVSVRSGPAHDSPTGERSVEAPQPLSPSLFAKEARLAKEISLMPQVNRPATMTASPLESPPPVDKRRTVAEPTTTTMPLYGIAMIYLLSNLTTLLIGVLLFAGAFWFLLRRLGAQLDALSRLRLVSVESSGPSAPPARAYAGSDADSRALPERFDLGMTYEEEMRQRHESAQTQEQAVLRQIFEQNMDLRKEIGVLSAA